VASEQCHAHSCQRESALLDGTRPTASHLAPGAGQLLQKQTWPSSSLRLARRYPGTMFGILFSGSAITATCRIPPHVIAGYRALFSSMQRTRHRPWANGIANGCWHCIFHDRVHITPAGCEFLARALVNKHSLTAHSMMTGGAL
jgi:hypothetical protein